MLERLANVVYWIATAVSAGLIALGALILVTHKDGNQAIVIISVMAALTWLSGRAVRYIITGR